MRIIPLILLLALTACQEKAPAPVYLTPSPKATMQAVEGQVFVALKNGSTLRLSAVPVTIYESTILMDFIQQHKTKWEKERAERQARRAEDYDKLSKLSDEQRTLTREIEAKNEQIQALAGQLTPLLDQAKFYRDKIPASLKERMDPLASEFKSLRAQVATSEVKKRSLNSDISLLKNQLESQDIVLKEDFDQYMFRQTWPTPALVTTTDADGEFKLELPNRTNFIIRASASRSAYKVEEDYEWLTPVPLVGPAHLNNHNCKVNTKKD